ncbi:hypothetical protein BU24DRAFT_125784 [Aaosphaeria arxii CBS 175.79]|uniref:Uncharacterized protein n=1 Tax=Aaosphaeria arxii CBS 175.79 TaxID=1450172 RepID=A0A6A5Y363_9PLEO|nr:uncharacterized protein BU24DRAFT_125784 [Aaosphaeria arxii CBS 175.79]KAF2019709.1 hypothetical protein BU24DRAFT_125784 [Aaosphaeria arxii CBS 175.79]
MSAEQTFTSDLRSEAKEFNRDKDHRVKWAHGQSFGPGRRVEDARPRPARIAAVPKASSNMNKARTSIRNDIAYASGDSSADEDVEPSSAAPAPDAEITYSYDATRGPSQGSQILGQALAQAIERFEDRQTDTLIKREYEVLDVHGDALSPMPKVSKKKVAPEDEDYEFIEA